MHPSQISAWLAELSDNERKLIEDIQFLAQEIQPIQVLEMLYHSFELLTQRVQALLPEIPCQSGCFACCEQGEPELYPVEAELLKSLFPEALHMAKQNKEAQGCPLLKEGRCSVYAARPLHCRAMGYAFYRREKALPMQPPQAWSCDAEKHRIQNALQNLENPVRYMYLPLLNQYQKHIENIDGPDFKRQSLKSYFSET